MEGLQVPPSSRIDSGITLHVGSTAELMWQRHLVPLMHSSTLESALSCADLEQGASFAPANSAEEPPREQPHCLLAWRRPGTGEALRLSLLTDGTRSRTTACVQVCMLQWPS